MTQIFELNFATASLNQLIDIARQANGQHIILQQPVPVTMGQGAVERMITVAENTGASIIYADRWKVIKGERVQAPTCDFHYGCVRNDFDFGAVVLCDTEVLCDFADMAEADALDLKYAAFYALHLYAMRKAQMPFHLHEYLYTEEEMDDRKSGEKQFDYVDPRNRDVQIEMEQVFTQHLVAINAAIDHTQLCDIKPSLGKFTCEASVIIPVRNRVRTIADAVQSALSQVADFQYNVIVVDNHSTDGTTEVLDRLSAEDPRCIVIKPERGDLGIGGCWATAVNDERCGRFAVQLDSDDLYSGTDTLQRIVNKFREEKCAMVIGSYRMCDFQLNTLPPGIIDHKEWTAENGMNNALRINGLGAPRAFYTPLLREIGVPNTSYGEDYALGLAFSRHHKIGRIYDELYLCRRWEGNSDAALSPEKVCANNTYKDQLRQMEIMRRIADNYSRSRYNLPDSNAMHRFFENQLAIWDDTANRYKDLENVLTKHLNTSDSVVLSIQHNPARIVSTGANISKQALEARPCFLCPENRPDEQDAMRLPLPYELLVNPFPILTEHFTLPHVSHEPQSINGHMTELLEMVEAAPDYLFFYNGPKCGASAPDHMHFQAGKRGIVPLERDWMELYDAQLMYAAPDIYRLMDFACPVFVMRHYDVFSLASQFSQFYNALQELHGNYEEEPPMNVLAWKIEGKIQLVVIPRTKHRPDCYSAEGEEKMLISPGALDMAGLIITPRREDYDRITADKAASIISECGLSAKQMDRLCKILATPIDLYELPF